jgi:hypothetical protein
MISSLEVPPLIPIFVLYLMLPMASADNIVIIIFSSSSLFYDHAIFLILYGPQFCCFDLIPAYINFYKNILDYILAIL